MVVISFDLFSRKNTTLEHCTFIIHFSTTCFGRCTRPSSGRNKCV